jgi:hypothetical protein
MRQVRGEATKLRYLMIFNVLHGRSFHETAQVLKVHQYDGGSGRETIRAVWGNGFAGWPL